MKTIRIIPALGLLAACCWPQPTGCCGQITNTNSPAAKTNFMAGLFIGTVVAVERQAKTVSLISGAPWRTNGRPAVVYVVTPETQITKRGQPASLQDARIGHEIRYQPRIRGADAKPMLLRLELEPPATPKPSPGP